MWLKWSDNAPTEGATPMNRSERNTNKGGCRRGKNREVLLLMPRAASALQPPAHHHQWFGQKTDERTLGSQETAQNGAKLEVAAVIY